MKLRYFSAKRGDRRNRADLMESATPSHDVKMVGSYRGVSKSNPLRLTVLAAMSEDYTTAPQHPKSVSIRNIKLGQNYRNIACTESKSKRYCSPMMFIMLQSCREFVLRKF